MKRVADALKRRVIELVNLKLTTLRLTKGVLVPVRVSVWSKFKFVARKRLICVSNIVLKMNRDDCYRGYYGITFVKTGCYFIMIYICFCF